MLLHDLQELDDHLGHRAHQHLTLSTLFGVVHRLYSSHTHRERERERERKVSVLASTQNKSKEDTHKKKKGEHQQQNKGPREEEVLSEIARAKARATDVASLFSRKRTFNVSLSTEIRTMLLLLFRALLLSYSRACR